MSQKITVVIEKDDNGYYAYAPDLKGCQTQGDTLDEVTVNIKEAVELYLETMDDQEKAELGNSEILTTSVEVSLA